jgi:hypothetical protein
MLPCRRSADRCHLGTDVGAGHEVQVGAPIGLVVAGVRAAEADAPWPRPTPPCTGPSRRPRRYEFVGPSSPDPRSPNL